MAKPRRAAALGPMLGGSRRHRGQVVEAIPTDQAWFFTSRWLAGEGIRNLHVIARQPADGNGLGGMCRTTLCKGSGLLGLRMLERWLHFIKVSLRQSVRLSDMTPVCCRSRDLGENV
jgi:hypothetical protein